MKIISIFIPIVLFVHLNLSAQSEGEQIKVVPSASHMLVSGSNHKMDPPQGFVAHTGLGINGFENSEEDSQIITLELPIPMALCMVEFTNGALSFKGLTVTERVEFMLNGQDAILISGSQTIGNEEQNKYILITGSQSNSVIVNGTTPINSSIGDAVKKSLLTFVGSF